MQPRSSATAQVRVSDSLRVRSAVALSALLAIACATHAMGALQRPQRVNRVETAFRDVTILKGHTSLMPPVRAAGGMLLTYSFKADYAAAVRTLGDDLEKHGWQRADAAPGSGKARFTCGARSLTVLCAKTSIERCPSTGRSWQRTTWPRTKRAQASATTPDPASGWITVECVLAEPQPAAARCFGNVKT